MSRATGDGLPWYRHGWPWFLVGLLGLSVVGSLVIVFLAFDGRDPLVREDWYADGVSINDDLARRALAMRSGIRARVRFEPERERIVVAMTGEGADEVEFLDLMFDHATRSDLDRRVRLQRIAPGLYEAMLPRLAIGRFYATLDSLYHAFDVAGNRHMEYISDRGEYPDLPYEDMLVVFKQHYGDMLANSIADGARWDADVEREVSQS